MKSRVFSAFLALVLPWLALDVHAGTILLGTADPYAVLAETTVTNPPGSTAGVTGNMGVSPGTACTGFIAGTGCTLGNGTVSGVTNLGSAAATPKADFITAYNALAATTPIIDEVNQTLGSGGTLGSLAPGVYEFTGSLDSAINLIGMLTLTGDGNSNDLWIFQMPFQFITASDSSVVVNDTGANAGVYFELGSQATLGTDSTIQGNILAGTAIVLGPGAQITCGRAFAQSAVNFDGVDTSNGMQNQVDSSSCSAVSSTGFNGGTISNGMVVASSAPTVPEPGTLLLLGAGLLAVGLSARRKVDS